MLNLNSIKIPTFYPQSHQFVFPILSFLLNLLITTILIYLDLINTFLLISTTLVFVHSFLLFFIIIVKVYDYILNYFIVIFLAIIKIILVLT